MKIIRIVDDLVDKVIALGLVLLLLVGVYFIVDTAHVYRHAAAARISFRLGPEEQTAGGRPYTDDYVARLCLDGTGIDYPVMQGEDNSAYLDTDPYGEYSLTGSIFLDSRNSADFSDSYCLLYGHHMAADLMFGTLDRYYDDAYFDGHRGGTLQTADRLYRLEVFAVLRTDAREDAVFDPQGSEAVIRLAREDAVRFEEPDNHHILACSTCVDDRSTMRTVVLLSMTEEEAKG